MGGRSGGVSNGMTDHCPLSARPFVMPQVDAVRSCTRCSGFRPARDAPKIALQHEAGTTGNGMKHTPEQQWSALSALYEEADALPAQALPAWLARLESTRNPLLPQLKRMLEARSHLDTDNFLGTLPKLLPRAAPPGSDWAAARRVGPYRLVRPLGPGGQDGVGVPHHEHGITQRQGPIQQPAPPD